MKPTIRYSCKRHLFGASWGSVHYGYYRTVETAYWGCVESKVRLQNSMEELINTLRR